MACRDGDRPNVSRRAAERLLEPHEDPQGERAWIRALRGKDLHNGALVALDYRTGDVLAYVGSAGLCPRRSGEPPVRAEIRRGRRRRPATGFRLEADPLRRRVRREAADPGSVLLDITTQFDRRQDWTPRDADQRERGPVLVRRAFQYSLNIPAVRALERVGNKRVADDGREDGHPLHGRPEAFLQSGLAGALGTVEVRPLDLTSAYGTIANGGVHVPPRMILDVRAADGRIVWKAPEPAGSRRSRRRRPTS